VVVAHHFNNGILSSLAIILVILAICCNAGLVKLQPIISFGVPTTKFDLPILGICPLGLEFGSQWVIFLVGDGLLGVILLPLEGFQPPVAIILQHKKTKSFISDGHHNLLLAHDFDGTCHPLVVTETFAIVVFAGNNRQVPVIIPKDQFQSALVGRVSSGQEHQSKGLEQFFRVRDVAMFVIPLWMKVVETTNYVLVYS
jgi:hypothetical protein